MQEVFNPADYPDLVVGMESPDDAAVWRLEGNRGLVLTTDFFTPVVDDPYDYGRIAAANSLSDIYAMGGKPFLALNISAFPPSLDSAVTQQIIRGGAEIARSAGTVIAGGHTVQDDEPKYGLVVAGLVALDAMLTKAGCRKGDSLYLTKPLGFGTITTALKRGVAKEEDVKAAVDWMTRLNREASELAVSFGLKAGTDITGYALIGHAMEMTIASGVGFRLHFGQIPMLKNAEPYARQHIFPGGSFDNLLHFESSVRYERELEEYQKMMLFDAQTSGGLLLTVPPEKNAAWEEKAKSSNIPMWLIGEVVEGSGIEIV
jgi:selenide,water dikinase